MNEPWTFLACNAGISCVDANGNLLWHEWDAGQDVAERVLACVNACAGMDDPAREVEQLRTELKLVTHKLLTCGVAATHPDPKLSSRAKDYGGPWDSPQAEAVRQLRAENARLRVGLTLALRVAEGWIHDQLDGTDSLDEELSELEPARAALRGGDGA